MTDLAVVMPRRAWLGPGLVLLGGTCIGFAPIGLRFGLGEMGPQAIAFWRYLIAVPFLLALVWGVERRWPIRPNRFVVLAGTFFALDIALWHAALTFTTVANSTFIVNLGNICVGFTAWIFLKERPSIVWAGAVIVAISGAGLLTFGAGSAGGVDLRGDALAFGAAILVSGYMLCAKIARRSIGALDVLFWVTAVEAMVAGLVTFVSGETFFPPMGISAFGIPLFLALVVQVAGQGFIIAGLGRTSAAIAGVSVLVQPVIAATLSWWLFDEQLAALQFLGAGLILGGVALAQFGASATKTP